MNKNQAFPWDHPRFRSWIGVARACQLMQQTVTRAIAELGIKPPHLDILINLYRFEGISQQELARKLLVGRSNMSMLLPQLEKRGLIERETDPHDNRVQRLHLSAEGLRVWRECERIGRRLEAEMFADMPEDDWHRLHDLLDSALASLDRWRAEHGGRGT